MVARIHLIRHGETFENAKHIIQGQLDTNLNETGVAQAQALRDRLYNVPFSAAFSSDSKRAADTARIVLQRHDSIDLKTYEALRERHMGELQGKSGNAQDLWKSLLPSVEPAEAFRARLLAWWNEVLVPHIASTEPGDKTADQPYSHILIVSHGAAISFLLLALLDLGYARGPGEDYNSSHTRIHNASISIIDVQADGSGVLVKVGDVAHLEKPALEQNADVLNE